MSPNIIPIKKALEPAYLKKRVDKEKIKFFKEKFNTLLESINPKESEEYNKNIIRDFLNDVYYKDDFLINIRGDIDLVIYNEKTPDSSISVLFEIKKPNSQEMVNPKKLNVKSFQQLLLYYLRQRITEKNSELCHLIITDGYEWFVFDEREFERLFLKDKKLCDSFKKFYGKEEKEFWKKNTDSFYKNIAYPTIENTLQTRQISCVHFNINHYKQILQNSSKEECDLKWSTLYKFLSPENLLKLKVSPDKNSINSEFYGELLHIIGLEERKKDKLERKKKQARDKGSIIENTISSIEDSDKLENVKSEQYGKEKQESLFNIALNLSITWINRILFLKLLEAQIIKYNKGNKDFGFLSINKIYDYSSLDRLFFSVLARKYEDREEPFKTNFSNIPYLNSSLFETTVLERKIITISNLRNDVKIEPYSDRVLPKVKVNSLKYLFKFLDRFDFSGNMSENNQEQEEESKPLISSSVLGYFFEKINGYKGGSYFTPPYITTYMCHKTIKKVVFEKFNKTKNWNCKTIEEFHNKIEDISEANEIFNSIRICDPSVGSGHFLVSALNEMIRLKWEFGILTDKDGKKIKNYKVEIKEDELIIWDDDHHFIYNPDNKISQNVQETFFEEKRKVIENCLFGVDINPNSVKICQLRLWIELLKHSYYKTPKGCVRGGIEQS